MKDTLGNKIDTPVYCECSLTGGCEKCRPNSKNFNMKIHTQTKDKKTKSGETEAESKFLNEKMREYELLGAGIMNFEMYLRSKYKQCIKFGKELKTNPTK